MSLATLWFVAVAVLWTGFFLLEGFDFGVGMLHGVLGRDEAGRRDAVGAIGPLWDGNEVWLIVAVAGMFAAFPGWYATVLSGFYPLMLVTLVGLILRGVSFEFRSHVAGPRGRRVWDATLTVGSAVIPFVLGVSLGGLLHGVPVDAAGEFTGNIGSLLSPYALLVGITMTALCLLHGAVFLDLRAHGEVRERAVLAARVLAPVTGVIVLGFAVATQIVSGRGVLISVPELLAVLAVITAAVLVRERRLGLAFGATSLTIAAVVASIFGELYPRVLVSTTSPANDLTVAGTASSPYALGVMTVVAGVMLPVVLAYQGWTYHVFRRRLGVGNGAERDGTTVAGAAGAPGT
ncbi:cytochrome d ubiquinol oxidase subunit II [Actinomycetospora endophytica]|uniref:Cytochrome d ubiquinol oxidase subunit II n=1 Tax=Actinomycetospora endophytica TaxID=2291215 RepID=A0ABS8PAB3_9PSEU|nr:cytochrome d ubiquinol oxidase subunit II [Actinomycetospora endophytica]MCD2195216.1 cytochrome d ubiquinol oxidase subunit II [Actinomycetospora endophytica]